MIFCKDRTLRTMRKYGRAVAGTLIIFLIFYLAFESEQEKETIDYGSECSAPLGPEQADDLAVIQSYKFPAASKYLDELFPANLADMEVPEYPTFVTAFDLSHFTEGMALVENINSMVRQKYKEIKLFIYDLGLTKSQRSEILSVCQCEIGDFPFEIFPSHVRNMKGYAWKPLAIQLVARRYPFVAWMDASVRFIDSDLDHIFQKARSLGVLISEGYAPIAVRTVKSTFEFLGEKPCSFRDTNEFEATFSIIHGDKFVQENFLQPWVSCALSHGCLVPVSNKRQYLDCNHEGAPAYHVCHRYDQSVLSLLMYRLYHRQIDQHRMKHDFYRFCKGGDELSFLPHFVNKLLHRHKMVCM